MSLLRSQLLQAQRIFILITIFLISFLGIKTASAQTISLGFITFDGANLIVEHTADSAGTYEFEFCLSPGGCTYPTITFTGPGTAVLPWGGYTPLQPNTTYTVRAHLQAGGAWSNSVSCTTNAAGNACTNPPPTEIPPTEVPPTAVPPTAVPPTAVPPTAVPPTAIPPTTVPPTAVPPTAVPPTAVPPTAVPPTAVPPTVIPPTSALPVISLGFITFDGANLIVQHTANGAGTYEFEFCLSPGGCSYPTIAFTGPGTDTLPWGGLSPIRANTTYTVRAHYQAGGVWSNSVRCTTNAQANLCTDPPPVSPPTQVPPTAGPLPIITLGYVTFDGANLIVEHTASSGGTYEFEFCLAPGGCSYPTITFTGEGTDTLPWGGLSPIQARTTYTVRARYQAGGAWSNSVRCTTNNVATVCTDPPPQDVPITNPPISGGGGLVTPVPTVIGGGNSLQILHIENIQAPNIAILNQSFNFTFDIVNPTSNGIYARRIWVRGDSELPRDLSVNIVYVAQAGGSIREFVYIPANSRRTFNGTVNVDYFWNRGLFNGCLQILPPNQDPGIGLLRLLGNVFGSELENGIEKGLDTLARYAKLNPGLMLLYNILNKVYVTGEALLDNLDTHLQANIFLYPMVEYANTYIPVTPAVVNVRVSNEKMNEAQIGASILLTADLGVWSVLNAPGWFKIPAAIAATYPFILGCGAIYNSRF